MIPLSILDLAPVAEGGTPARTMFGTLGTLYPGGIDLGLGRAPRSWPLSSRGTVRTNSS